MRAGALIAAELDSMIANEAPTTKGTLRVLTPDASTARDAALEEAAKACDNHSLAWTVAGGGVDDLRAKATAKCAAAIRALRRQPEVKG